MRRRDFLKILAAGVGAIGLVRIALAGTGEPGIEARDLEPAGIELPIRGDPHTLSSGCAIGALGDGSLFGADPVVCYGLPDDWRDRYVLGIQA